MLFATKLYFCRNETFVMTNISRDKHACHDKTFVATNTCLLRQKFCHDKHIFVATKDLFCLDKHMFLATNYKTFVPTKMILVAAPANDSGHTQPFCAGLPRWDTVEAEIKVPSVENTEHTNVLPWKSGVGHNHSCHRFTHTLFFTTPFCITAHSMQQRHFTSQHSTAHNIPLRITLKHSTTYHTKYCRIHRHFF